jgi:hypothetical protein
MIIFFNAHARVEVPWTSPILIPVTHAHLVKKIQPMSMPGGLQFVKKNCAGRVPHGITCEFFKDTLSVGYVQK